MALSPNVVVVAPGELITSAHLNNVRANLDRLDIKLTSTAAAAAIYSMPALPADVTLTTSYQFVSDVSLVGTPAGYSSAAMAATFTCQLQVTTAGAFILQIECLGPNSTSPEFAVTLPVGFAVIAATWRAAVTTGGNTTVRARARTSGAAAGIAMAGRSFGVITRTAVVP